ncbi:MAG TPA: hypothetical protein VM841_13510, partial [Actinomycetota bacterium]|nr:hypothetical protein [Actinomycetota bacterium]
LGTLDGRGSLAYGYPYGGYGTSAPLFDHDSGPGRLIASRARGAAASDFRGVYTFPLAMMTNAGQRAQLAQEVLAFLGAARASSTRPPSIRFERFMHVVSGTDKAVAVGASGAGLSRVELWYRPHGLTEWTVQALKPADAGLYRGTIPGSAIGSNGIDYFVRAMAGSTPIAVSAGGAAMPNVASGSYGAPAAGTVPCP